MPRTTIEREVGKLESVRYGLMYRTNDGNAPSKIEDIYWKR